MPPQGVPTANGVNESFRPSVDKKLKAKSSRRLPDSKIPELEQEDVEEALTTIRGMTRILSFARTYQDDLSDVEYIYGLEIRQQERIKELEAIVAELYVQRDNEFERLQTDNKEFRARSRELERTREELEEEKGTRDDAFATMESQYAKQKDTDVKEAKREMTEKVKAKIALLKEEHASKAKELETENQKLKEEVKKQALGRQQALDKSKLQEEEFHTLKNTMLSHIRSQDTQLREVDAVSIVSPQTPEFYVNGFRHLEEIIRDVAINHLTHLPEDANSLDNATVRGKLSKASKIFRYPLLSSESAVSSFLRECAIRNFLSVKLARLVQRLYFTEETTTGDRGSISHSPDRILDILSNVQGQSSKQDMAWRLATVEKLDRIGTECETVARSFSTLPDQADIVQAIMDQLHYFQSPADQELHHKLTQIADRAVKLWSALRRDSCRLHFGYDPGIDQAGWTFIEYQPNNDAETEAVAGQTSPAQLPPKPFVLFPRITGSFDSDASSRELHPGLALSHDSSAFRECHQEIASIERKTAEFKRSLRRGSSAKSSPVMAKSQSNWPGPQNGLNHRKQESVSNVEADA